MLFVRDLWYVCACVYESSEASAYSFGLATNPNPTRSYPLNINPKPDLEVADLYYLGTRDTYSVLSVCRLTIWGNKHKLHLQSCSESHSTSISPIQFTKLSSDTHKNSKLLKDINILQNTNTLIHHKIKYEQNFVLNWRNRGINNI